MIVDCIADLHGHYPELEGGDLLIVAGDLTAHDKPHEYVEFACWLANQKYKHKIFIGGNHDNQLVTWLSSVLTNCNYLIDSGTEFEGLKIWGSPWTLRFEGINPECMAFTCDTEEELAEKWALIPVDTDILVTHSPPYRILDSSFDGQDCGSDSLMLKIRTLKLKAHIFGHIHEDYGKRDDIHPLWCPYKTVFINASHVNERYQPVNKPIRVVL